MKQISFDDFKKVEIRIGKVVSAEPVEGSEKLLKLQVDFGMNEAGEAQVRQILSGIAKQYSPETLVGTLHPFAFNLAPRAIMGMESQGMILAADGQDGPVLLVPDKEVPPGSAIK